MTIILVIVWMYNFFMIMVWLLVTSNSGALFSSVFYLPIILAVVGGFYIKRFKNLLTASIMLLIACLVLKLFIFYFSLSKFQLNFEMLSSLILHLVAIVLNSMVFPLAARKSEFQ
jgi:hypothetical protein